ncbi:formate hydrogenlyase subunit 3/multisubunit Na+/H+ antiporter, MnhD subunit [Desulfitobacterium dichloroeliminans LMG P-21439]|uniref:Formate hydrogenlyase subunit 3/multisubunit Na+/H+ antiporter, MnhD subunit n=1 Tax=Desulfitobacterium dichloroeliminans (strain LMG P-21439 / DCA1) TaxID=871963 RepID=L0F993_DESDL|nr:hydrogenase 4 subunit F [Desulfitobacterium dichloroeliminans]AGA70404.1 formate hydrogenlyase subunit 3/multisubunit Na+/H+ antiporter, MnhD subunit [Desulfitobacterium dichloroeliminans LMG P-21439]
MFIVVAFLAALCMLISSRNQVLRTINSLAVLALLGLAGDMIWRVYTQGPQSIWGGFFTWDALSALLLTVIAVIAAYVVLYSFSYMEHEVEADKVPQSRLPWYYFWIWMFIGTMLWVVSTPNLGLLWVGIEGTTLATALLVGFYREKPAVEAAWKYIVLCTVGISFALLGTMILYAASGRVNGYSLAALDWRLLVNLANQLDPALVKLGFVFAFIGYGAKVGFVPMHPWLPDAHSQAPSPVSALLSGVLLNCALYAILRWHILVRQTSLGPDFSGNLLIIFGLLSLGAMVAFILLQKDIKRLLAYSSVEHMGIIALGFGIGTPLAVWGACFHLILHALTKANLFVAVGRVVQMMGTRQIPKMRGILSLWPYTGGMLLMGLLAITGTPPFGTFRSEINIMAGLFQAGHPFLGFLTALFLSVIFAGFLYHFLGMLFGKPNERHLEERGEGSAMLWLALPLALVLILGVVVPEPLNQALNQVVELILGGGGEYGEIIKLTSVF